ncbi:TIM-barrel domain-containing protein [Nonomuraea zeae]|uniref:Glycosyl hydrolase family 31 C-terminal domain-containing protein n=1 Tax=Nonomuraea zeae TaxID=1642303 RepID=A0A5S4GK87_9ACTN|nr:hypothetical protein ETD85_19945 [Nonomuraea zeae]
MRGLFVDHPRDPGIWRHPLRYKLGDALLVAPVTEPGRTEVTVYLPEGEWIDVWTGAALPGGGEVILPAALDRPPVVCAAGHWTRLTSVFTD